MRSPVKQLIGVLLVVAVNVIADGEAQSPDRERQCDAGSPGACMDLGISLYGSDKRRAAVAFGRACELGVAEACGFYGHFYHAGIETPSDYDKANPALRKACDAGFVRFCDVLGASYEYGYGVPKSPEIAIALYRMACLGRDFLGCSNARRATLTARRSALGPPATETDRACDAVTPEECVARGTSLLTNSPLTAAGMFNRACDRGNMDGCAELGGLLKRGIGNLGPSPMRAVEFLMIACDGGHGEACVVLATSFERGELNLDRDVNRAKGYAQRSCDLKNTAGCDKIKVLGPAEDASQTQVSSGAPYRGSAAGTAATGTAASGNAADTGAQPLSVRGTSWRCVTRHSSFVVTGYIYFHPNEGTKKVEVSREPANEGGAIWPTVSDLSNAQVVRGDFLENRNVLNDMEYVNRDDIWASRASELRIFFHFLSSIYVFRLQEGKLVGGPVRVADSDPGNWAKYEACKQGRGSCPNLWDYRLSEPQPPMTCEQRPGWLR